MEENKNFNFQQFINDSKDTLLKPKEFFSRMETSGGFIEPIIKALIYGVIAGFFTMIWSILNISSTIGFGGTVGIGAFFLTAIGALIGAFIGGVILLVLSSICKGNTDYEANLRVAVALMVIFPISSFLNILLGLGYWVNTIVSLAVNLYALYLLYYGLSITLKGKEQTAKVLSYVLGGIFIFMLLIGLATKQATKALSSLGDKKIEQQLKKYKDAAEDIAANYEEEVDRQTENLKVDREESESASDLPAVKPNRFPEDAAEHCQEWFSKEKSNLSAERIEKIVAVTNELKRLDNSQEDDVKKILESHGYDNIQIYSKDLIVAASAFEGIKILSSIQAYLDASKEEQDAAKAFTIDEAMESILKQVIRAANLSVEDLRIAYENWGTLEELGSKD